MLPNAIKTARKDDPSLTVRGLGVARQPVRVVVSRRLDLPLLGQLARTAKDVPLWICHGKDADPERLRAWAGLGASLLGADAVDEMVGFTAGFSIGAEGLPTIG